MIVKAEHSLMMHHVANVCNWARAVASYEGFTTQPKSIPTAVMLNVFQHPPFSGHRPDLIRGRP